MTEQPVPPAPPTPSVTVPKGLPPAVHDAIVATLVIVQTISGLLVTFLHRDFGITGQAATYTPLFTALVVLAYGVYMATRHRANVSSATLITELEGVVKALGGLVPMTMMAAQQAHADAFAAQQAQLTAERHRVAAEQALAQVRAPQRAARKTTVRRRT